MTENMRIFIRCSLCTGSKSQGHSLSFLSPGILFRNPIRRHTSTSGIQISQIQQRRQRLQNCRLYFTIHFFKCLVKGINRFLCVKKKRVESNTLRHHMGMISIFVVKGKGGQKGVWGGSTSSGSFCNEGAVKAGIASRHHFPTLLAPRKWIFYMHHRRSRTRPQKFLQSFNAGIWFHIHCCSNTPVLKKILECEMSRQRGVSQWEEGGSHIAQLALSRLLNTKPPIISWN